MIHKWNYMCHAMLWHNMIQRKWLWWERERCLFSKVESNVKYWNNPSRQTEWRIYCRRVTKRFKGVSWNSSLMSSFFSYTTSRIFLATDRQQISRQQIDWESQSFCWADSVDSNHLRSKSHDHLPCNTMSHCKLQGQSVFWIDIHTYIQP